MPKQKLKCRYCDAENFVPITPHSLDYEGNNPSTRLKSRRGGKRTVTFTCTTCKKENVLNT